jgi:putative transcriptional regulator
MSRAGTRMVESARQALAYAEGQADPAEYGVHLTREIDVEAIRAKLGMSQPEFARCFGVSTRTVRSWERRERRPSGPARAFLEVIEREPEAVRRALIER